MNRRKDRGWFSVFALTTLMLLLLTGLGIASYALHGMNRANHDRKAAVAYEAAQAGLEHQISKCLIAMQGGNGEFTDDTRDSTSDLQPIAPGCTAVVRVQPLATDARYAWITSTATYLGKTESIRTLVTSKHIGVWNNAIFAGTGAAGASINGNVDIRGSIHVLGSGEYYTDSNGNNVRDAGETYNDTNGNGVYDGPLAPNQINSDFGGNAYVGNNYSGMPALLESLVPPPPVVTGKETLGAEVRVKRGLVSIGGSSSLGTAATVDGGLSKGTLDGVYVTDGFTGNKGASGVYSDNGTNEDYDISEAADVTFPVISGAGAEEYKVGATLYTNQQQYLDSRSLVCPVTSISARTPAFSYGPDAMGLTRMATRSDLRLEQALRRPPLLSTG
jgi:hypothetical protein